MKISACIIVRDEPLLAQAVASVRGFVDEIVIVDTGSADTSVAERLADKFLSFTDCNDADGHIANFSLARQKSFDIATHDCVLWLDADDEVYGLENLRFLVEGRAVPTRLLAPYEYTYNDVGECIRVQQRERVVTDKNAFMWARRVHEGLVARPGIGTVDASLGPAIWKHRRAAGLPKDPERNLRILRATMADERPNVEPRTIYDLGVECYLRGLHLEAEQLLNHYIAVSGWDAERFQACLRLSDLQAFYGNWKKATEYAQRAVEICPDDPNGMFALAKLEHRQASGVGETRALERASFYGLRGLSMPDIGSSLLHDPQDRILAMPEMLADVAGRLGDSMMEAEMLDRCLKARPNDRSLQLRRHTPSTGLDIVIACGRVGEMWNPDIIAKSGMGGSETAVVEMGKRLAAKGCRVRVFCDTPVDGLFDGVEYRSHAGLSELKHCDLLVAWRDGTPLSCISAKAKWLWVHDTSIAAGTQWNLHCADRVLALSQWHAEHLVSNCGVEWEKVSVTSNGIDLSRFEARPVRNPRRALYTSSPDRGLEELLKMWPTIKAEVPDAELRVFYGWGAAEAQDPKSETGLWLTRVKVLLAETATLGVSHHGRVDQTTLANEMLQAGAWLYPSWAMQDGGRPFTETNCISAREAQAAGLHVVAGAYGALPEAVRTGELLEYGPNFIEACIEALREDHVPDRQEIAGVAKKHFSWDIVVDQWLGWADKDVREKVRFTDASVPTVHLVLAPHVSGELPMDPHDPQSTAPTGGCRDGFLGIVKALGTRGGYRVRAFATFKDRFTFKDGVEYLRLDEFQHAPKPDALVGYYDTSALIGQTGMLRIASHHTYTPYANFEWTDVNLAPSRHALESLRDRFDPLSVWHVLPNGVELSVERKPVAGRVIYHTSPDRGLHHLLAAWPEIRRRLPHATLHVTGTVEKFANGKYIDLRQRECAEAVGRGLLAAEAAGGLSLLGRLPRAELDRELSEASVFAFPCQVQSPCETFSVSVMECLAIGLPVVLRPADALRSVYEGAVRMVEDDFVDAVCETLTAPDEDVVARGRALAAHHTFANQAEVLASILRQYLPVKVPHRTKASNGFQAQAHGG